MTTIPHPPQVDVQDSSALPMVHRIEIHTQELDGASPLVQLASAELAATVSAREVTVYLISAALNASEVSQIAEELLADPVNQSAVIGVSEPAGRVIEVHYQPGVMDPVAQSTRAAIAEMLPGLSLDAIEVRTGVRVDFVFDESAGAVEDDALRRFAAGHLGNPVIQDIHLEPYHPEQFVAGRPYDFRLTHVDIRGLDEAGLMTLSRDGHLFLDLNEMQTIQRYYQEQGREPTDIELESLAQTWSEHCVHKTLKSTVHYTPTDDGKTGDAKDPLAIFRGKDGHEVHADGSVTIHNLLKSTVAAATHKLMAETDKGEWCVSVFEDNAGIVKLDEEDGVCIKVETHNHPSAIEPYGGAATGIGGCIRDVLGTGLCAKPIANTDTFCVAHPETAEDDLPKGVIHPKRTLEQVVAGVRDYGNRMGIPTVNGAVYFDEDYVANPLVFAGCIGILPLDKCFGDAQPGDHIIALGGATGRDGIHGATFSSAELTDTHADEFSHAVQIGNAITQKKMHDVVLQARDHEQGTLFSAITDCGAGGFSSAVGEMGEKVGANVHLERAPLKYDGLTYTEIWISEAQERLVLSVPAENIATLRAMCEAEDVPFCDLGEFGCFDEQGEAELRLHYHGEAVGRLTMDFLHNGVPTPTRVAAWPGEAEPKAISASSTKSEQSIEGTLKALLAHPNIASKHWVVRQYDHEVQGGSVVKPLVGPMQDGPSDAAVIRPKLETDRGVALSVGMAPHLSEKATTRGLAEDGDSYHATLNAIDEAVRNAVCVGADPSRLALLDNFCWPRCDDPKQLGSVIRAAEACYDGAMAFESPFVSGKDSLSNQFTTEAGDVITIPPTMLITALSIVEDVTRAVTMDAKAAGNVLLVVGETTNTLGGSHLVQLGAGPTACHAVIPKVDLEIAPKRAAAVAQLIAAGLVASAHDCSDGGLLLAATEMAFAGRLGLTLDLTSAPAVPMATEMDLATLCFAETPSRYLLEVKPECLDGVLKALRESGQPVAQVGLFTETGRLTLRTEKLGSVLDAGLDEFREAWQGTLDW